jgi:uridine phosphorylase
MADIKPNINLTLIFQLIQEIKQGIKQQCYIEITDADVDVSGKGLRITIQAKNYKTKEFMYYQQIITERELIKSTRNLHTTIIKHIIDAANNFFRKEQEKQSNADYCPCCDSHTCTCNAC